MPTSPLQIIQILLGQGLSLL